MPNDMKPSFDGLYGMGPIHSNLNLIGDPLNNRLTLNDGIMGTITVLNDSNASNSISPTTQTLLTPGVQTREFDLSKSSSATYVSAASLRKNG